MKFKLSIFYFLFFLFPFLFFTNIHASTPTGFNHPELNWYEIETKHFKIIYNEGIEEIAYQSANIGESVFDSITTDLDCIPLQKIVMIVSEYEDVSNGLATPLGHTIFIWAYPELKYSTGTYSWLREVIAHELTHIITFWSVRTIPYSVAELIALGGMPTWFIEGLAQYEGETWDINRDMFLRVITVDDNLLPQRKLKGFIGSDRIDARLVYEQGHSLIYYITNHYGKDSIKKILKEYRRRPISFNRALKKTIGISEKELYRNWKKEITLKYASVYASKEHISKYGTKFPSQLQGNLSIRYSPDGKKFALVAIEDYEEGIPRLYVGNKINQLAIDSWQLAVKKISEPYIGAFFSWSPDSKCIIYSKERLGKNNSYTHDLYMIDSNGKNERRITDNLRASEPAWSPDGEKIAFTFAKKGISSIGVAKIPNLKSQISNNLMANDLMTNEKILKLPTDNRQLITHGFTPSWSPDSKKIVFSIFEIDTLNFYGKRDIAVWDLESNKYYKLTDDIHDDRYPAWSPDGNKIAFISYRNGIPNLYTFDIGTNEIHQLTDVGSGVFNPVWNIKGDSISITVFDERNRIDIYTIPVGNWQSSVISNQLSVISETTVRESPITDYRLPITNHRLPITDYRLPITSYQLPLTSYLSPKKYNSILSLRPIITAPWLSADEKGLQYGLINYSNDPLEKHTFCWWATYSGLTQRANFSIDYTNSQLSPNIDLHISNTTNYYGIYRGYDLYEKITTSQISITQPINFGRDILSNHSIEIGGRMQKVSTLVWNGDAYPPTQGNINSLFASYGWNKYKPGIANDIHPKGGQYFYIRYEFADSLMRSKLEYNQLFANYGIRLKVPYTKDNIIGLNLRGLLHYGDQLVQNEISLSANTIRGVNRVIEGNKIFTGSLEYRFRWTKDIGIKIPFFYFETLSQCFFTDFGNAWYDLPIASNFKLVSSTGTAIRLRTYLYNLLPVVSEFYIGVENRKNANSIWGIRIGSVF